MAKMKVILKYLNLGKLFVPQKCRCSSLALKSTTLLLDEENINLKKNHGKNDIIRTIQNLLNISYKSSLEIVERNRLTERNISFLTNNYQLLIANGVNSDTVMKYPELLGVPFLESAISDLKTLPYSLTTTIVLACLVKPKRDRFLSHYRKLDNKIDLISKIVQVSCDAACEFIYKKDFLISKDPKVLAETLKLILDFGIPLEEIRKDLWVLKYSPHVIRSRIEIIEEVKIEKSSRKPWMIRCPVSVIETYARRRIDNRHILGNDSLTEFISKKLKCTEEQAKCIIMKMPALRKKSLKTITDIINFLYSKGFNPNHIYRNPKILVHSIETTKKRLEQLEKSGLQVNSLYMLTKSQKQFNWYLESSIKGKTKLPGRINKEMAK
ncbi:hypothetical protein WA026_020354 [Henosepilachna vigintioctopunctata]|uniref:Mitochondrial transcription termination factor n=1 Tax=Henosepilachna vigintioctopunctata TaxID=420089 RepID=A0AAW1TX93_9CUCU